MFNYIYIGFKQIRKKFQAPVLLVCVVLFLCNLTSTAQYLRNGAMESDTSATNNPPDFWAVCDSTSSPDTQYMYTKPNDTIISYDLSMFTVLRVRSFDDDTPSTSEDMFTELITPLEKGYCYIFSAYLLHSYMATNSPPSLPVKLQLWGGLDSCSKDEMFYESEVIITNHEWLYYEFKFSVEYNDYPYFYIRPWWDFETVSDTTYNGIIMLENLEIQQLKVIETDIYDTVYFSLDPPKQLEARESPSYSWFPPAVVSDADARSPYLVDYSDLVVVTVLDEDHCPIREHFVVLIDCDTVFPALRMEEYDMYYSLQRDNILEASEGFSYHWEPQAKLTDSSIRNPITTDYEESFTVEIEDEYGCSFYEQFNMLIHCDTLYPQKSFFMLDTIISDGESIVLVPSFGDPSQAWVPPEGLSCVDCRTPEASPILTSLYTVQLTDQFECTHEEKFAIEVIFKVPNVITPNGDGFNDEFIVRGLPPGSSLQIYSKDGGLVYQNPNYGYPEWWSGTDTKGNKVSTGNYWFALEIPALNQVIKDFVFVKR